MSMENVILWYEQNVNYRITKAFLDFLIGIGLIKNDIDLDFLNMYLLERNSDDFIIENGKYKIKTNRIPIISKFKDEVIKKIEPKKEEPKKVEVKTEEPKKVEQKKERKPIITFTRGNKKEEKPRKKFQIKNIGGNRMKLVKL